MRLAKKRGQGNPNVAVARKLAMLLHRLCVPETHLRRIPVNAVDRNFIEDNRTVRQGAGSVRVTSWTV